MQSEIENSKRFNVEGDMTMTREDIFKNIQVNYGKFDIDMNMLEEKIQSGEAEGFSYRTIYTGLRMALSATYGTNELFSVSELAETLGETEEGMLELIEEAREELIAMGEDPDEYFPGVPSTKFMLPKGFLQQDNLNIDN